MQSYRDYHQVCHILAVSCAVVKMLGFDGNSTKNSTGCQNISFRCFDQYTDLGYDISIEP